MPLNLAENAPPLPDVNDPNSYNQAVLDGFNFIFNILISRLDVLTPEDYFQVMSSLSDATADRLMKVGAFGVGAIDLQNTHVVSDANSTSLALGYYAVTAATSGDVPSTYGILQAIPLKTSLVTGTDQITQKFWPSDAVAKEYIRHYREGYGWTAWEQFVLNGNDAEIGALTVSGGIDFGQTTLDYYEEGSWSPVLTDGSNNATAVSNGTYTRVGDLVTLTGRIPVSSLGALSGTLRIGGFPFVTINSSAAQGTGLITLSSGVNLASANTMFLFTQQGNTFCYISEQNAGGTAGIQASEFTNSANIQFSITYRTA